MAIDYKEDYGYASSRLANTIAMCEQVPIYIKNVSDSGIATYYPLNNRHVELSARYKEIDLSPIQLGFMNDKERRADYVYRLPTRVQRQGLYEKNVVRANGRLDFWETSFINCVMGVYPTIDNIVDRIINDEATSLAFSRSFMLSKHNANSLKLSYKMTGVVGAYLFETSTFKFTPKYSFLKDVLDRTMGAIKNEH